MSPETGDMSRTVQKCPISQCWRILFKNCWIWIQMPTASKI